MAAEIHISLAAEKLFQIGNIPITNSMLTTWISMAVVIILSLLATSNMKKIPGRFQSLFELMIGGLWDLFHSVLGERTKVFFPLLATMFVFILFMNWIGLVPGVGTIGYMAQEEGVVHAATLVDDHAAPAQVEEVGAPVVEEHLEEGAPATEGQTTSEHPAFVPLLRAGTADLNTTLALALIAVGVIQYAGLKTLKGEYVRRFINFSSPVYFFVGILELVSEFSRIISFAFRLFGNVFAGEVLLTVIAFFIPLIAPIPFMGLELFVGFIQALVFAMLTAVFLSLATTHAEH